MSNLKEERIEKATLDANGSVVSPEVLQAIQKDTMEFDEIDPYIDETTSISGEEKEAEVIDTTSSRVDTVLPKDKKGHFVSFPGFSIVGTSGTVMFSLYGIASVKSTPIDDRKPFIIKGDVLEAKGRMTVAGKGGEKLQTYFYDKNTKTKKYLSSILIQADNENFGDLFQYANDLKKLSVQDFIQKYIDSENNLNVPTLTILISLKKSGDMTDDMEKKLTQEIIENRNKSEEYKKKFFAPGRLDFIPVISGNTIKGINVEIKDTNLRTMVSFHMNINNFLEVVNYIKTVHYTIDYAMTNGVDLAEAGKILSDMAFGDVNNNIQKVVWNEQFIGNEIKGRIVTGKNRDIYSEENIGKEVSYMIGYGFNEIKKPVSEAKFKASYDYSGQYIIKTYNITEKEGEMSSGKNKVEISKKSFILSPMLASFFRDYALTIKNVLEIDRQGESVTHKLLNSRGDASKITDEDRRAISDKITNALQSLLDKYKGKLTEEIMLNKGDVVDENSFSGISLIKKSSGGVDKKIDLSILVDKKLKCPSDYMSVSIDANVVAIKIDEFINTVTQYFENDKTEKMRLLLSYGLRDNMMKEGRYEAHPVFGDSVKSVIYKPRAVGKAGLQKVSLKENTVDLAAEEKDVSTPASSTPGSF